MELQSCKSAYNWRNFPIWGEIHHENFTPYDFFLSLQALKKIDVNKYIADYLIDRNNIILYLIIVFFFSVIFVNVFTPFQGAWYYADDVNHYQLFMYSLIIVFGGILVMAASRAIMIHVHKKYPLTYLQLFAWAVFEFILIGILYTLCCRWGLHDTRNFSLIFGRSLIFIPVILVIPTTITILYLSVKERDRIISELRSAKPEEVNGSSVATPSPAPIVESTNDIINFTDDKGELKLSVRTDCIYYLEASDNYINIYYRSKEAVEHFLLRSSMKKQDELLSQRGFVRCHRSYMVNFSKVALLRKDKNGPYLDLGESGIKEIPISKTYLESVTKHFTILE